MKKDIILLIFLMAFASMGYSQRGRILLVGGGGEKNNVNGWSVPAYKWAVQGKRVAVIGSSTGSLAPYLKQYCGAAFAKEFAVASRDSADSQVLFDTLMTYQAIFFRGGDQYDYYSYYKGTRLQLAAETLFTNGGTLAGTSAGMHILSSVIFTAKKGTVYPYEAIENPNNSYMTLADDFFDFFPNYLFDTHFAERARFARLAGFLAKYSLTNQKNVIGLGLDDMTCMAVDTNNIGTVYGTGCANFYSFDQPFVLNGTKLLHPGMNVKQLPQGSTYNFSTGEFTTAPLDRFLETDDLHETGNLTLLASGGNTLANNNAMLNDLVTNCGNLTDQVLILTGDHSTAQSFETRIEQAGASVAGVFLMDAANGANENLAEKINSLKKLLFVANPTAGFNAFLNTPNGLLLQNKLKSSGIVVAFVGDDARFAGKTVVDNYYTSLASWYGELEFSRGLCMLKNTVIMPNTYFNSDIYENTATAVPYAMVRDTLRYGIWLTSKSYMKVLPVEGYTTLTGYGQHPVMVLRNEGGKAGYVTQTSTGSSSAKPRMVAGFENLVFSLVDETLPYQMGQTEASSIGEQSPDDGILVFGNPTRETLLVKSPFTRFIWKIINTQGLCLGKGTAETEQIRLNLKPFDSGVYVLHISDFEGKRSFAKKIIKL